MARLLAFTRLAIAAGFALPPTAVPAAETLPGALVVTLVVDDPKANPPTDADFLFTVEASADNGLTWTPISTTQGGTSGTYVAYVPARGRLLRVAGHAKRGLTLDLSVEG